MPLLALTVEHVKCTGSGSTHDFIIRNPIDGVTLYALETETKHIQRVIKFVDERKEVLAKIQWRGNGRDLIQLDGIEGKPVPVKSVWNAPTSGERYVERFTGADGKIYTWSKVVLGTGKEAMLEVHLTRDNTPTPIARYTSPDQPNSLRFGLPNNNRPTEHDRELELAEGLPGPAGEMLVITFLVALGRAYANNAFTIRGFLDGAVETWTRNLLGGV